MKSFLLALLIFSSWYASANALLCKEFYDADSQRSWLARQAAKARDYVRNSRQEKEIGKIFRGANDNPRDLVTVLQGPGFKVSITDYGLASRKAVDVIMEDTNTHIKETLMSSQTYGGFPTIKNYRKTG